MPYSSRERQRQAQRQWATERRRAWLATQSCGRCGARRRLSVFGAGKGAFTSGAAVRAVKLADAVVLCESCVSDDRRARARARHQHKTAKTAARRRAALHARPSVDRPARSAPKRRRRVARKRVRAATLPRVRVSIKPLERLSGLSAPRIAEQAGRQPRTGYRWRQRGLSVDQADVAAIAVGWHPVLVWGDLWEKVDVA